MSATIELTDLQWQVARRALGLPNDKGIAFRNHYYAPRLSSSFDAWMKLVELGYARRGKEQHNVAFHLTRAGAKLVLQHGERLDPEDFPDGTR